MEKALRNEIVLIGPVGVGKTTTAKLLAEKLSIPHVAMDLLLEKYMREVGYSETHWREIVEKQGKPAGYRYLKVFGSHAVRRLLDDHRNCVFDFGGGGVTGEFPDEWERIQSALAPFRNVVFLIPAEDKKESLQFLYNRMKINPEGWTILEHLVYLPSHELLAKHTVYTKGKTPQEIANEILRLPLVGEHAPGEGVR